MWLNLISILKLEVVFVLCYMFFLGLSACQNTTNTLRYMRSVFSILSFYLYLTHTKTHKKKILFYET